MVDVVELDRPANGAGPQRSDRARGAVEDGGVVYMPRTGFTMTNREHRFLDPGIVQQPRVHSGRARIIYLPEADRLLKTTLAGEDRSELHGMMTRFTGWA